VIVLITSQTMYLTYARVLLYPAGWKIFAGLNTMHHAFMYAYFGGAAIFSDMLPWTGTLQLVAGMLGELYVIRDVWTGGRECGNMASLWANWLALGLLSTYLVLFTGDLRARGENGKE
jgi:GNS1/SUR4 family